MVSISVEAIVFLIIGGVVVIFAMGFVSWFVYDRRRRKRQKLMSEKTQPSKVRVGLKPGALPGAFEQEFGLQFIQATGTAKTFTTLPVTFGRSDQNDLVLDDDTVSAEHARVYYDEIIGAVCIVDLDSANGIRVNDLPTRKNILQDGAKVRLGSVELEFHDTGYIHPL